MVSGPSQVNVRAIARTYRDSAEPGQGHAEKAAEWRTKLPEEEKQTEPHLKGTSAIQFITTSNITIPTLDILKNVYINIFSCKDFDADVARGFSEEWFKGKIVNSQLIERL